MIISRTPYRISLAGGGTDLAAFYQHEPGAVLSLTIDRHIYVVAHRTVEPGFRINCGATQTCASARDVSHDLVREALILAGVSPPLDVTVVGDLPWGTGLGSSSALSVGLLHAFRALQGEPVEPALLAREACEIEIDVLGKPIGRQDQYAAAFGGVNRITFDRDHCVNVRRIELDAIYRRQLESCMLLVHTGRQRHADQILQHQVAAIDQCRPALRKARDLARRVCEAIENEEPPVRLGGLLNEGWLLKRSLGFGISDEAIDTMYQTARDAGAWGGKLLGAGGGGFLFFVAPPERHEPILDALGRPLSVPVSMDAEGTRVIFRDDAPPGAEAQRQCGSS